MCIYINIYLYKFPCLKPFFPGFSQSVVFTEDAAKRRCDAPRNAGQPILYFNWRHLQQGICILLCSPGVRRSWEKLQRMMP